MIKLLIGGSPCTYWSIAQKGNRETEAEGLGWELFKNYLIAKEKFKPDFFLYENNKSAAQAIKDQISRELGVDLMYINSALVSAQNRQRFYAFNWEVEQPEDRHIQLGDILESGLPIREKAYTLDANYWKTAGIDLKSQSGRRKMAAEPIALNTTVDGKAQCLRATYYKDGIRNLIGNTVDRRTCVAEPIRIGTIENEAKTPEHDSQQYRVYSPEGKSVTLCGNGGGVGAKTGLYATPIEKKIEGKPIYEVINEEVEIKGKRYPVKLPDGLYVIRKLTPLECERLQTLPDGYTAAVSNTQRYKGLGNGWTAEIIIHILNGALKDVPRDEEIVVLSMYDGIGTGRYCLEKMGFKNVTYYAYEIDEPAMKVALSNYPDIIQMGDAFDLRSDNWELGKHIKLERDKPDVLREAPDNKETEKKSKHSGAVERLRNLVIEREALAEIHPDTDCFIKDAQAIEYAVNILEAMTV